MPRKLELTWFAPRMCWKKRCKVNGRQRTFYFKYGANKSDMEGYRQALAAWKEKKRQIDAEREAGKPFRRSYEKAIQSRRTLARWCREHGEDEQGRTFAEEADELQRIFTSSHEPPPLTARQSEPLSSVLLMVPPAVEEVFRDLGMLELHRAEYVATRRVWMDRLARCVETEPNKTVGHHADRFIARKQSDVPESLSPGRWHSLAHSVRVFRDWIGATKPIAGIDEGTLEMFREHLLQLTKADRTRGGIGRKTANERLKDVRQFLRWCWQTNVIDNLPRNIDSSDLSISFGDSAIVTFTEDEVMVLLNGAGDRMRLYLLLALNCAMLPKDISELTHDEVDWETGHIRRQRSKTRRSRGSVPVVTYKLWDISFDLLRTFRSDDPKRVLLNANGQPLKRSSIREDGKIQNTSNIAKQYERLRTNLDVANPKPFKTFRATGASKLEEHDVFGRYAQYYLGQAPRSVADKHYVQPSDAQFEKAIRWLGEHYGVG